MSDDILIALLAAILLAADEIHGATWEASGDGQKRDYDWSTLPDAAARARALLAEVRKAA